MKSLKQHKLKDISQNEEFIYWSEINGFVYLEDFFEYTIAQLNTHKGFTPRLYKELADLVVRFGYEDQIEDFA